MTPASHCEIPPSKTNHQLCKKKITLSAKFSINSNPILRTKIHNSERKTRSPHQTFIPSMKSRHGQSILRWESLTPVLEIAAFSLGEADAHLHSLLNSFQRLSSIWNFGRKFDNPPSESVATGTRELTHRQQSLRSERLWMVKQEGYRLLIYGLRRCDLFQISIDLKYQGCGDRSR